MSTDRMLDNTFHSRSDLSPERINSSSMNPFGNYLELLRSIRLNNPNVQRIVIEDRALPPMYIRSLLQAVAGSRYLTHLRLIRVGIDDSQAGNLAACLRQSKALTLVDWSKNQIGDESCRAIAKALSVRANRGRSVLKKLSLEANNISDDGLSQILGCLNHMRSLTTLKLGHQPFTVVGVRKLCSFLETDQSSVSRLDLREINLDSYGAKLLSLSLAENKSVERLVLARNNLDSSAAVALAHSLLHNRSLVSLDLQRNDIDDTAAKAFANVLERNHVFGKVKLRNTRVSDSAKQNLLDLLLINSYGPELASATKQAYAELLVQHVLDSEVPSAVELDDSERSEDTIGSDLYDEVDDNSCVICCGSLAVDPCIILPCRHSNACSSCCAKLQTCHMCRSPVVKIFGGQAAAKTTKKKPFACSKSQN